MKTTIHNRIALGTIVAITFISCQSEITNENAAYERYKESRLKQLSDTNAVQNVAVATVMETSIRTKSMKHKKSADWTRIKLKLARKKEKK